jgi:hypothetical protein
MGLCDVNKSINSLPLHTQRRNEAIEYLDDAYELFGLETPLFAQLLIPSCVPLSALAE